MQSYCDNRQGGAGMNRKLIDVRLRAMEPEDLDMLYRIENDKSLWGVGVTNVPYSRYTLHDYIANTVGDIYTDKQVRLIVENEQGESVGLIDITNFDPRHLRAELGIVIQSKFRGKGYATSAIHEIMEYASDILHLHQLYIYVDSDNVVSKNMFQKIGFTCSIELKDWLFDGKEYRNAWLMQYFL